MSKLIQTALRSFLRSFKQFKRKVLNRKVLSQTQSEIKADANNKGVRYFQLFFSLIALLMLFRIIDLSFFGSAPSVSNYKSDYRAKITDVNGNVLAYSELRYNVYFDARKEITAEERVALIDFFNIDNQQLDDLISKKKVILVKRFATKNYVNSLSRINRRNIFLVDKVLERKYPYNDLLSHSLGFVGYDQKGLSGLELAYERDLTEKDLVAAGEGVDKQIVLNINKDFQKEVEEILKKNVTQNEAVSGSIIVQEVNTGKVIALANYPSFDLNQFYKYNNKQFRNLSTSTIIDPGSIFKVIFSAYLMENFQIPANEKRYFCEGYYELENGERIKCHARHGSVSLEDIIKFSCNSGIIEAMEIVSNKEMYEFLSRLGIGEKSGIDLPGEVRSRMPKLNEWGLRTRATIPLGQGLSISPIQLSSIFSAFIGNGEILQPRIVEGIGFESSAGGDRFFSEPERVVARAVDEQTVQNIIKLLVLGTVKGSTGNSARNTGLEEVFGKTGTSQLVNYISGGYYTDRYDSIFAGGYPSTSPQYSVLVVINQPKKEYYGGKVAAPIYAEVIEELIFYYGLNNERVVEYFGNSIDENIYDNDNDESIVGLYGDLMPDLVGLSLRESLVIIDNLKKSNQPKSNQPSDEALNLNISGNGYVFRQEPLANESLKSYTNINLYLR